MTRCVSNLGSNYTEDHICDAINVNDMYKYVYQKGRYMIQTEDTGNDQRHKQRI